MAGTYRKIYNTAMETQWDILFFSKNSLSRYVTGTQLMHILKEAKEEHYPFLSKMDGGMLTSAAFRANESFRRWFDNYTPYSYRRPKFLSRKKDSMTFKTSGNVRIFENYIEIPKLGKVKLYEKGYLPQDKVVSNITFSHDGNDWWISLEVRGEDKVKSPDESYRGDGTLDLTISGDVLLNEKVLVNPVSLKSYEKAEKKKKSLERKLKRQSLANIQKSNKGAKTRTSRNMMKTRKLIAKIKTRLEDLRKDGFKKQACEIARTKLQKLHCLPSSVISQRRQGGLSRKAREKHALDFFNIIKKRVALEGTQVLVP